MKLIGDFFIIKRKENKYTMKIFLNIIPVSGINLNFEGTAEFLKKPEGA